MKRIAMLLMAMAGPAVAEPDTAILTRCLATHAVASQIATVTNADRQTAAYRWLLGQVEDEAGLREAAGRMILRLMVETFHHDDARRRASVEAMLLETEECEEWLEDAGNE